MLEENSMVGVDEKTSSRCRLCRTRRIIARKSWKVSGSFAWGGSATKGIYGRWLDQGRMDTNWPFL